MENSILLLKEMVCLEDEGMLVYDSIAMDTFLLRNEAKRILIKQRQTIMDMEKSMDELKQAFSKEDAKIYEEKIKHLTEQFDLKKRNLISRNLDRVNGYRNDIACRRHYLNTLNDGFKYVKRLIESLEEVVFSEAKRTGDITTELPEYTNLMKAKQYFLSIINTGKRLKKNRTIVFEEEAVGNDTDMGGF